MSTWTENLLEVLSVITDFADDFFKRLGDYIGDVLDAFPNLVKIADLTLQFFTGILGLVVASSATSYLSLLAAAYRRPDKARNRDEEIGSPYQHVMRPDQAAEWIAGCMSEGIKTFTTTSDTGLIGWALQKAGIWLWSVIKRLELLKKLIAIKSEQDAIGFVVGLFRSKRGTLLITAILAIVGVLLILACATACKLTFYGGTVFAPRLWEKHILFPNHPRKKERIRIYRRVGGVRP